MSKSIEISNECPMNIAFNVLDGKYKLKILWHLSKGTVRFNELQRLVGDVTQKTLAMQLRQLEEDKLIFRKVFNESPPRVEYGLTPIGESIKPILGAMCQWGKEYSKRKGDYMEHLIIQECSLEDIEAIKYISVKTFCETFEDDNSEEDMASYLEENFSYDQIKNEVSNPESKFFIVKDNEEVAAYMKLNVGKAQTEEGHEHALEVQRIYVLKDYKGKGIGGMLMQEAIKSAKDKSLEYVWLGVWEHNYSAQRFYEKYGFKKFSEHIFKLGDDEQTDYLMKLML